MTNSNLDLYVKPFTGDAVAWDTFAHECDGSFRCGYMAGLVWQFEHHWVFKLRRLNIFLAVNDQTIKIGQVAVGVGRRRTVFSDGVLLLPRYRELWTEVMRAILAKLGAGEFFYGSDWSLEPARTGSITAIEGVQVLEQRDTSVQAVDFSRWPDWSAYYAAVSQNAKRNVSKGLKLWPQQAVHVEQGLALFYHVLVLQFYRSQLFKLKGVKFSLAALSLRSLARTLGLFRYTRIARCIALGRALAFFNGIEFGKNTFFMEAAQVASDVGLSSCLLKEMVFRAHQRSKGLGKFVMGPDDGTRRGDTAWRNLMRSREQWRATEFPTSIFRFSYAAPGAS